jgi:hypothetical protein
VAGVGPNFDGPVASPPVHSLVRCAPSPDAAGQRWEYGFRFRPDNCIDISTWDPHCDDPPGEGDVPGGEVLKTPAGANEEWEDYFPVLAETVYQCDSTGWTPQDDGAALRQLEAAFPKAVGFEFWTGELRPTNRHLADVTANDVTPTVGTAVDPVDALASLVQAIADCGGGGRGMIHATPYLASLWACGDCIVEEGNCLVTKVGRHIVVPDPGYPGTGPNGAVPAAGSTWAYATGMVQVLLGPAQVLRPDATLMTATVTEGLVERHGIVNAIEIRAERAFAAWWGCCHAAVLSEGM